MKVNNGTVSRGTVLLAELKALVNSFPHQQRADVIQTLKVVFSGLDDDYQNRHSVRLQPEANTVLSSPFGEAPASTDLDHKRHSENQKQKEGRRRKMKCSFKQWQGTALCLMWTGAAFFSSRWSTLLLRVLQ